MKPVHRPVALALAAVLFAAAPSKPVRAESGVNAYATIGLLVAVVGVLGWVAWQMEKEDEAEAFPSRALLPLGAPDAKSAVGFYLDPEPRPDDRVICTAGLALGRRF